MKCPQCFHLETKVLDSRLHDEGTQVRRRRECDSCNFRFNTYESPHFVTPRVIKQNDNRETFNPDKLRTGVLRALEKRPVSADKVDDLIAQVTAKIYALGDSEVDSRSIGEWVMDALLELDAVAYIRFASVYKSFQDIEAFSKAIHDAKSHGKP